MDTPSFDYRPSGNQQPAAYPNPQASPSAPAVESASASTSPQVNNSNFAYYLTGIVLGLTALLFAGLASLFMNILDVALMQNPPAASYEDDHYDRFWDYGEGDNGYDDFFNEFEQDSWL